MTDTAKKAPDTPFRAFAWSIALATALILSLPAPAAQAGSNDPGTAVRFQVDARTHFNPWITDSTRRERDAMRKRYWRMRGYAPFFDQALRWAPPSRFYRNSLAIYDDASDQRMIERNPHFVLRDDQNRPLYIDFDCGGGCPLMAADISQAGWRRQWISGARARMGEGYAGIFVDDVNLEWRISDRHGNPVRPIDRSTGEEMTLRAWRSYVADFMEQIREEIPRAELVHNALWWVDHDDRSLQRQIAAADFIQLERGYNDRGIVDGTGKYGYVTFMRHIDWLHRQGVSVILRPKDIGRARAEYELAGYFLTKARRDTIVSDYRATPDRWWRGWRTDLGAPKDRRKRWRGLFRRDFKGGMVLTNQPYSRTRTVHLPASQRFFDLQGKRVRRVTLGPTAGRVLSRTR